MKNWIIVLIYTLLIANVQAQTIDDFVLTNVLDNQTVTLTNYHDKKIVVVIFMGNNCPFVDYYNGRIKQFEKEYQAKSVSVVLVNSHLDENEISMKSYAQKNNFSIPYLADKQQTLMKSLGVKKSPSAVVLKREGENFTVFYQGAIDNNPQVATDVSQYYLRDNVDALISGKPRIGKSTPPMGCLIHKK